MDQALPPNQEAETIARDLQDWHNLQLILNNRSLILQRKGDLAGAMAASTEEEQLCRRLKKVRELTVALENQGFLYEQMKKSNSRRRNWRRRTS